jgi:hypothetical protein
MSRAEKIELLSEGGSEDLENSAALSLSSSLAGNPPSSSSSHQSSMGSSVCWQHSIKLFLLLAALTGCVLGLIAARNDALKQEVRRMKLMSFLRDTPVWPVEQGTSRHGLDECNLIFTVDGSVAASHNLSLFDQELELLGTLIARVCDCACPDPSAAATGAGGSRRRLQLCEPSSSMIDEILMGANIVVSGDGGWFHDWFSTMGSAYERTSSHYSTGDTIGVPEGHLLRTLLSGLDIYGNTWFQLEGANWSIWRHPLDSFKHVMTFVEYKVTGDQVGPLGRSVHTDERPIRTVFDGCAGGPAEQHAEGGGAGGEHRHLLSWRKT